MATAVCRKGNMQGGQFPSNAIGQARGAFIPAIAGILIVSFVAATEGAYGAWMLWIAVPMLMISLGYIYLINALAGITAIDTHNELLREQEEMHPKE
jgi:hypothetical protein